MHARREERLAAEDVQTKGKRLLLGRILILVFSCFVFFACSALAHFNFCPATLEGSAGDNKQGWRGGEGGGEGQVCLAANFETTSRAAHLGEALKYSLLWKYSLVISYAANLPERLFATRLRWATSALNHSRRVCRVAKRQGEQNTPVVCTGCI